VTDPTAFARRMIHKYGSERAGMFGLGEVKRHHEGSLPDALRHWQAYSTQGGQVTLESLPGLIPGVGEGYNFLMELIESVQRTPAQAQEEALGKSIDKALVDWREKYLGLVNGPQRDDGNYAAALKYALAICGTFGLDDRGLRQWQRVADNA